MGIQHKTGLPAVTVVFTILHAGGKFGGGGYKVAGGLHGVGASVVNALSVWLEVEVYHEGKIYHQRFEYGKATGDLEVIGDCPIDQTGTTVTFKPDAEIFKDTTVYDYETLQKRLREQAFLNAGVHIELRDERDPEHRLQDNYCYQGGISSFVEFINKEKEPIHEDLSLIHICLPADQVCISSDEKNITAITCGPSEFSIVGIPAEEYPEIPSITGETTIELPHLSLIHI